VLDDALRLGGRRMDAMAVQAPGGARFAIDYDRAEPGRYALGLSRRRLDHLLLERARAAGVEVVERAHVRDVIRDGDAVRGVGITVDGASALLRAPLVIGADGRHSAVTRALGLDRPPRWP